MLSVPGHRDTATLCLGRDVSLKHRLSTETPEEGCKIQCAMPDVSWCGCVITAWQRKGSGQVSHLEKAAPREGVFSAGG